MFPAGCMRVLAVDGDPTCLKVLENLLLRCDYHVTTTGRAATALKLLRENKDQFDLMISEIHLPDMDGFKLLELVSLEMDLPVIMMSANGETQTVMKGITHGACDYLLKPMRLEQLKTIWQHVVRRNTNNHGSDNDDAGQMGQNAVAPFGYFLFSAFCNLLYNTFRFAIRWLRASPNVEAVGLPSFSREKKKGQHDEGEEGGANHNKWQSLRDRDENGDDGDDSDENSNDNGDSSSQKKPRVVWSVELHRKFVAAVNQLGIDKAVPKKILDLMNVENITRENVATHLQKYRQYLKRLSMDASRQVNLVAALGGKDPAYSNMNSLDVLRHYNNAYGRYQPVPANTHSQPNNLVARVNSPSSYGMRMLLSSQSQPLQLVGHAQNYLGTSLNDLGVSNGTLFPMEFNQDATAPFTFGSSTKSGEVLNSNLACSNSGINLRTENSVVPRQAPGGGNTSSAPSLLDGMVEQQTVGNQLNYNDDLVWTSRLQRELSGGSDDVVIDISRPLMQDNGNHGVFSNGDW